MVIEVAWHHSTADDLLRSFEAILGIVYFVVDLACPGSACTAQYTQLLAATLVNYSA